MNITVYTKSACPNCTAVKSLLRRRNLGFVEISLDNPTERETFFVAHPLVRQMPQVFINDRRVGGLEGLRAAIVLLEERGIL
jgi:glutaredoxin 3